MSSVLAISGTFDSGLLSVAGVICLVILTLTLWRRSQQRRSGARELTREQRARLRDQEQLCQALEELLRQLEETAQRVDAQIGARTTKLEELLRQADDRFGGAGRDGRPSASSQAERVYELADQGRTPITIAEALHMPVGEVELLLNVRGYAARGSDAPPTQAGSGSR